jgi:23S rRNA (cytidine1920-2'-O)/16S rRNA (cytidine1409-2'-O)-methyltransferase
MKKIRIDLLLVSKGFAQSREKAQALIMEGKVRVNGVLVDKAGRLIPDEANLEVEEAKRYVSRGGEKLEGALKAFNVNVTDKIAMDVGSSTGGFTQCLLEHGAKRVYAVDVGYGIISEKLRSDPRVVLLERTNIRYLERFRVPEAIDIATIDVSFISLKLVLPRVKEFLCPGGIIIALIKPQFEVGKGEVEKGGVIRDEQKHKKVVEEIKIFSEGIGLTPLKVIESPVRGKEGNREFFIFLSMK